MYRPTLNSIVADRVHQLKLRRMAQTCACGAAKSQFLVICHDCWNASPIEIRNAWRDARKQDVEAKRAAARELIQFARGRKSQTVNPKS